MTSSPESNPWPEIIGPCYTAASLQRELGMRGVDVTQATHQLRLLRIVTSDGIEIYPAFQIRDRQLLPGLDAVLRELSQGSYSQLQWAQWLNRPVKLPGGGTRRRIDELAQGQLDTLVQEARNTASAWLGDGTCEVRLVKAKVTLTIAVTPREGHAG